MKVFSLIFLAAMFWNWRPNFADPFLASTYVHNAEPQYWLVDSGASRTVIAESALGKYKILKERHLDEPLLFQTADAGEVVVQKEVVVECYFRVLNFDDNASSRTCIQKFEIRAVVGPVQHNLLSVSQLVRSGHHFVFDSDGCVIQVSELKRINCTIWCGVPWVESRTRIDRVTKSGPKSSSSSDARDRHDCN